MVGMPNRISTTDRVHALLREEIVSGKLTSGSLHSIYALATRYGVSRTPVRDALLRLSDSGMVRIERNRGVRIRGLGVHDIREVFETHLLIEVPAASYAAAHSTPTLIAELEARLATLADATDDCDAAEFSRRDRDLHRTILAFTGNQRLVDLVESLRDLTQSFGVSTIARSRSVQQVQAEHAPIVDAIRTGDAISDESATVGVGNIFSENSPRSSWRK